MTDYKKQAEDALSPDLPTTGEHPFVLARALLACAADLEQAEKERDEAVERLQSHIDVYIDADNRAEAAEAERDRLAAAAARARDLLSGHTVTDEQAWDAYQALDDALVALFPAAKGTPEGGLERIGNGDGLNSGVVPAA